MPNNSGKKSLDKIGESPKVKDVIMDGKDIVIQLQDGFLSHLGKPELRADNIKDIWTLFRHNIIALSQIGFTSKLTVTRAPFEGTVTVGPPMIPIDPSQPVHLTVPTGTALFMCIPKGKSPNDYGHIWDGGNADTGYIDLKDGDLCLCGQKRWTLPANPDHRRCTPMDHCYPSPPSGTLPKGTKCFCGKRRAGIEPVKRAKRPVEPSPTLTNALNTLMNICPACSGIGVNARNETCTTCKGSGNVVLSDKVVDAFLSTQTESDPARTERIKDIFEEKLQKEV